MALSDAQKYYDPADPAEAAAGNYVSAGDAKQSVAQIYNDLLNKLDGGHLQGPLILDTPLVNDATDIRQAATREYVNSKIGGVGLNNNRMITSVTTASLAPNTTATGNITLANSYKILHITSDQPARVRLYTTPAKRDADLNRPVTTAPINDHGLVFEFVTTSTLMSADISPTVDGFDGKSTPDGNIAYSITNNQTGSNTVKIDLTWVRVEGV